MPAPSPAPYLDRRTGLWLLAALVVLLLGIGLRFPWPADEPRFAQSAREMVESGQWLFPTRGGEFYPDKPPVFIWLIALAYQLIGQIKIAFLLPSALAAMGTLLLVHDLGRRLWNPSVGRYAVLVLLFTPQFLLQGKVAQIDALVCFWITLGCYGLLRHFFEGPNWRWYFIAWAAMALGIMTKGVGFLPLLMLLPLALWARNPLGASTAHKRWRPRLGLGPLVMLAVLACWLLPMLYQVHQQGTPDLIAYRNNILFKQTAQRYAAAWGHIAPWHYFFTQAIPLVWFPLPVLLLVFWRRLAALLRDDKKLRVLLTWVALVLLFFSISKGKREVYILPALPMLALVVAVLWAEVRAGRAALWTGRGLTAVLALVALGLLGTGLALHFAPGSLLARVPDYAEMLAALDWALTGLGAAWLLLLVVLRRRDLFERLAASSLLVWAFVTTQVWPALDAFRTPQRLMAQVEQQLPREAELGLLMFKEQFLLMAQRPITHFSYLAPLEEQERSAWAWMHEAPQKDRELLVPTDAVLACFDLARARSLGVAHRREWVLLAPDAMRAQCEPPANPRRYQYTPVTQGVLP